MQTSKYLLATAWRPPVMPMGWNSTYIHFIESNTELSTETSLICKNKARFDFLYPSLFLFIS